MSPYTVSLSEVIKRHATSEARVRILTGLLDFRADLRAVGINDGLQWLDGSFVEDVEGIRGRAPADMDLVTFAHLPVG